MTSTTSNGSSSEATRPRTRGSKATPEKNGSANTTPRKTRSRRAARVKGEGSDEGSDSDESVICEDVSLAVNGKRNAVRGKAWRTRAGDYLRYHCVDDGCLYQPGDAAYIESQGADQPFFICIIQEFRKSKRDTLMVNIKWFYRPCEVPETVYQLLVQDRNTEHNSKTAIINDPVIKSRELFISDATDTYPVSLLRGICRVQHFADIHAAHDFQPVKDSFFYILGYNPETRRLASTQGEIRVGPSHQARLPELRAHLNPDKRPERCENWEEPRWVPPPNAPGARDGDLLMYLRAARSMAAFAGLCDGGSPDDGCIAASRDDTTINAMDVLHSSGYDPGKALQALVKCPVPKGIEKKWSEDETKRFVKGLRQYGKNFFRIRKDLLQHKETSDLVEFYYLWKKTPAASNQRPHRRRHRQSVLRRIRTTRNTRAAKEDPGDPSSASEDDNSDEDSDSRDLSGYHCRHCLSTTSKDWHHAGKDKTLLCTDCRLHFKKYAELPSLKNTGNQPSEEEAPYMFRPVQNTDDEDTEGRVRTRTRTKELNARNRSSKPDSEENSPEPESEARNRKSPAPVEQEKVINGSASDSMVESAAKGLKRPHAADQDSQQDESAEKKKKNEAESAMDSQSNSCDDNGAQAENDADPQTSAAPPPSIAPPPATLEPPPVEPKETAVHVKELGCEAELKIKADLLSMVKLEPDYTPTPLAEEVKNLPKEEKITLPAPPVLCPPALDMSLSSTDLPPSLPAQVPVVSASGIATAPPILSPHSAFIPPAAHSAFARPFASHLPAEVFPPPKSEYLPPPPAEQNEPHNLKIKQEVTELPPVEIKKEPGTQLPSPRIQEKSVIVTPPSASRKTGPSPTPAPKPSRTPPSLPYQSPFMHPPFALPPQGMQLSYPASGAMNPYAPYGYGYPFPYYPPHLRMMTPGELHPPISSASRVTPTSSSPALPKSSPSPRPPSSTPSTHGLFSPHQSFTTPTSLPFAPIPSTVVSSAAHFAVPTPPVPGPVTPESRRDGPPPPEKATLINLADPVEENNEDIEEDAPSPVTLSAPRGPSPEPRIEDSECHRSQSAIFLRHWNRGEGNSCSRTDLTFKPVPDSKLARKREERLRRQAEKEREEREKEKERERAAAQARKASTPDRRETPKPSAPSNGPTESLSSPGFERFVPRSYADTPALRQLSEYARPHTGFSPGGPPRSVSSVLGLGTPTVDPMLHYQLASMYGPGARERLEMELEREKREREYRELREREINDRFKEEMIKNGAIPSMSLGAPRHPSSPMDHPHWLELQRRFGGLPAGFPSGSGLGPTLPGFGLYSNPAALNQLERERMERMGLSVPVSLSNSLAVPPSAAGNDSLAMERFALTADSMLRLQMAEMHTHAHTHAHAHAHTHTHLHLHPGQENAPQNQGFPLGANPGAFPRPPAGFLHQDNPMGLHPAMLGRPYDEQLARQLSAQVAAHEHLQRQIMERFPHPGAAGSAGPPQGPGSLHPLAHPSLVAQHEEFLRQQQREREMKVRALEEAARGGRQ